MTDEEVNQFWDDEEEVDRYDIVNKKADAEESEKYIPAAPLKIGDTIEVDEETGKVNLKPLVALGRTVDIPHELADQMYASLEVHEETIKSVIDAHISRINNLSDQNTETQAAVNQFESNIDIFESSMAKYTLELNQLRSTVEGYSGSADQLRSEVRELRKDHESTKDDIKETQELNANILNGMLNEVRSEIGYTKQAYADFINQLDEIRYDILHNGNRGEKRVLLPILNNFIKNLPMRK